MRLMMIVLGLNFLHGVQKKKLSLNLATSNNANLTSRGHWTLVIGPRSFTASCSSFDQVRGFQGRIQGTHHVFRNTVKFFFYRSLESGKVKPFTKLTNFTKSFVQKPFALVPVFWHLRWRQKWLQGIKVQVVPLENLAKKLIKPPRSPCLDSDRMHACTRFATRQNPWLRSRISLLWMTNERLVCSERHCGYANFEDRFSSRTCVHSCRTCLRLRKECSVEKTLSS